MPVQVNWSNALNLLFILAPRFLNFLILLMVGLLLATLASQAVTALFSRFHFDTGAVHTGLIQLEKRTGIHIEPASLPGQLAYWLTFVLFLIPAINALGLATIKVLLSATVMYIPNVFGALLILFMGILTGRYVSRVVHKRIADSHIGNAALIANIAQYAIIGFAVLLIPAQAQIESALLNIIFTAIVGVLALVCGVAYSLNK